MLNKPPYRPLTQETGAGLLRLVVAGLLAAIVVGCSGGMPADDFNLCNTMPAAEADRRADQPADALYDFNIHLYQGQDVVGGAAVALSDLRGQAVVLNFWAGLCPPCRAELPEFQAFADEYEGRALVVGVDLGQFFSLGNQDDATKLLNELSVTYPAGYTDDPAVVRELGVLGLPATLFINAEGQLHRKWVSILSGEKLAEITDEMLAR